MSLSVDFYKNLFNPFSSFWKIFWDFFWEKWLLDAISSLFVQDFLFFLCRMLKGHIPFSTGSFTLKIISWSEEKDLNPKPKIRRLRFFEEYLRRWSLRKNFSENFSKKNSFFKKPQKESAICLDRSGQAAPTLLRPKSHKTPSHLD